MVQDVSSTFIVFPMSEMSAWIMHVQSGALFSVFAEEKCTVDSFYGEILRLP